MGNGEPLTIDANSSEGWDAFRSSLGDLAADKSFEPIKSLPELAKSFTEAQKMIGGSIRLPKSGIPQEERTAAIDEILGKLRTEKILESIPDSPDKYEIKFPTEEGFEPNQPLFDSFRQMAHKNGITPTQAQAFVDWYINYQAEADRQEDAAFDQMKSDMKKEFGALHGRKMEAARRAVFKYLGEDGDGIISQLPPDIGAKMVRAFAQIGEPLLEDELVSGELPGVTTKEQLKAKIDKIVADPKHPLWNESAPGHKEAVEEWTKLQRAYAELTLPKT